MALGLALENNETIPDDLVQCAGTKNSTAVCVAGHEGNVVAKTTCQIQKKNELPL